MYSAVLGAAHVGCDKRGDRAARRRCEAGALRCDRLTGQRLVVGRQKGAACRIIGQANARPVSATAVAIAALAFLASSTEFNSGIRGVKQFTPDCICWP